MCPGPSNDNNYNNNRRTCRDLAFCGYHVVQLLEIVNYLYKNSQAVKKGESPKTPCNGEKKMRNPRWWLRNGYDGRLMAKILITTFQVNLCCLLLGSGVTVIYVSPGNVFPAHMISLGIRVSPHTYH